MSTIKLSEEQRFSMEEFGSVKLGNGKRTSRLLLMAERLSQKASGKVTETFETSAERQGAYKFLENDKIKASPIAHASHLACAKRCAQEAYVFVCADGSTLSIDDETGEKGLGPTGTKGNGSGIEVMSAIAVQSNGAPIGVCGQAYWTRKRGKPIRDTRNQRSLDQKETHYWLEVIKQTENVFSEVDAKCQRWYQFDRGADFHEMLSWAYETKAFATVRAAQNRRVIDPEAKLLRESLLAQPVLGEFHLPVVGRPKRKARIACIQIRTSKVTLELYDKVNKTKSLVTLTGVLAREHGTVPENEKPIDWLLLTNYPVATFEDARQVIFGYSQRWKIEEFHKSWKSVCGVEKIQLREFDNIVKLAVMLAAVAIRVERLKYLARTAPDLLASTELNQHEIDALIILRKPKGYLRGQVPTLGEAVRWIADLGGYTGKSSGGPPGTIVIGRGLLRLKEAAEVVSAIG